VITLRNTSGISIDAIYLAFFNESNKKKQMLRTNKKSQCKVKKDAFGEIAPNPRTPVK
jgi:hypothetical protein